jgi:hypothetical protein
MLAAKWIADRKGFFEFSEIIEEVLHDRPAGQ